jgi:predicted dehydrogenase
MNDFRAADLNSIPSLTPPARIGLIGAGAFGRFCIEAYRESSDLQVVGVADPNQNALALVDAPGARVERDWQTLVDDPSIEVLHLSTPPFLRRDMVLAALDAGKSVFCEKPLALTLEEADAMIAAARAANVALGVNYVMRHHILYRLLLRLAASGVLGTPRTLAFENYAQTVPAGHWFWDPARSGGIFVEHGVHFFDVLGQIAGPAECIWGSAPRPQSVEATVQYRSGMVGRYYHEFAFPREVEYAASTVMFDRGRIRLEGWIPIRLTGEVLASSDAVLHAASDIHVQVMEERDGVAQFSAEVPDRQVAYRDAISAGMRDVMHRHRDARWRLIVPPEAARVSLALALLARKAVETPSSLSVPVAE